MEVGEKISKTNCRLKSNTNGGLMALKPRFADWIAFSWEIHQCFVFCCVCTHREMLALQWENSTGMTSARPQSLDLRPWTWASKTCANSNLCWRNGWAMPVRSNSYYVSYTTIKIVTNYSSSSQQVFSPIFTSIRSYSTATADHRKSGSENLHSKKMFNC